MGSIKRFVHDLRRLARDRTGNAAMIFGLAVMPLMGATGLAVDTLLAYNAEDQLQKSLDAAALAAGRSFDPEAIESEAQTFFNANFQSQTDLATLNTLTVNTSSDQSTITLTATAQLPTRFMQLFGEETMTVRARTVVVRQTTGLELALVLDNTGSMLDGNKIGSLRTASLDLINILYGDRATVPNLWISVVPYIGAVNVGRVNMSFLSSTDRARGTASAFAPDIWAGCVLARSSGSDRTDDPPSVRRFSSYLYPDVEGAPSLSSGFYQNDWGSPRNPRVRTTTSYWSNGVPYWDGYGPNVGCPTAITPLVAEKATLVTAINDLKPWYKGGTVISEGLAWGWRTISPRWRNLWSGAPSGMPLDYGAPNMEKVIVLLPRPTVR
jgi:Flp pilus assembly protein TadG